jgi:hypothetical protein
VVIYPPPLEHGPPHVHAKGPGWVVVINLEPMEIRETRGDISLWRARRVLQEVEEHRDQLLADWKSVHG